MWESRTGIDLSRGRAARFLGRALRPEVVRGRSLALHLDVDGTLVSFAPTPGAVIIDRGLRRIIDELCDLLEGALAIVSGRSFDDLERLFPSASFALAGCHGAQVRASPRRPVESLLEATAALRDASRKLVCDAACDSRLLVETKDYGVALHYRRAPDREAWVRERVERVARTLGPDFCIQWGAAVAEIRAAGFDKSTALARLHQATPFAGRCPLYFGDDDTDLPALEFVERNAGVGVVVGPRLDKQGRPHLEGPSQVREVLLGLSVALRRAKQGVKH